MHFSRRAHLVCHWILLLFSPELARAAGVQETVTASRSVSWLFGFCGLEISQRFLVISFASRKRVIACSSGFTLLGLNDFVICTGAEVVRLRCFTSSVFWWERVEAIGDFL